MMNAKSIYATPSNLDHTIAAFRCAVSQFGNGLWIPFAVLWFVGVFVLFAGIAQETQGWAELFQTGGQAALDGYFATVHSAHLGILQQMSDGLSGHSILIGGVLQGWGMFIAFAVVPLAFFVSLAGAAITSYRKIYRRYRY